MKECKHPKARWGWVRAALPPCQQPRGNIKYSRSRGWPQMSIQSLGHFPGKTDPQDTRELLEIQGRISVHKQKISLCVVVFVRLQILFSGASQAKRKGILGVLPACFHFLGSDVVIKDSRSALFEEDAVAASVEPRTPAPASDSPLFPLTQVGQKATPQSWLLKTPGRHPWNQRWQFTKLELLLPAAT